MNLQHAINEAFKKKIIVEYNKLDDTMPTKIYSFSDHCCKVGGPTEYVSGYSKQYATLDAGCEYCGRKKSVKAETCPGCGCGY